MPCAYSNCICSNSWSEKLTSVSRISRITLMTRGLRSLCEPRFAELSSLCKCWMKLGYTASYTLCLYIFSWAERFLPVEKLRNWVWNFLIKFSNCCPSYPLVWSWVSRDVCATISKNFSHWSLRMPVLLEDYSSSLCIPPRRFLTIFSMDVIVKVCYYLLLAIASSSYFSDSILISNFFACSSCIPIRSMTSRTNEAWPRTL